MSAANTRAPAPAGCDTAGAGALSVTPGASLLIASDITVGYGGKTAVLEDLSVELKRGEVLAVIGPNGAGKTTLFKALSGELPLRAGKVELLCNRDDRASSPCVRRNVQSLKPRSRALLLSRVLQNEQPAWPVNVEEYVETGLFAADGWFGRSASSAKARIASSLETMDIAYLAKRPVTELSGGEFRRVVIARALVQDTGILLLDEPTADLDLANQMETLSLLRRLARAGKALAFSVHDLNLAAMAADSILLIAEGHVRAFGPPGQVLTPEIIASAYGARVQVKPHPSGLIPQIILDPDWLRAGTADPSAGISRR